MSRHLDGRPLTWRGLCAALGVLALGFSASSVSAQSLGPDPYQPFNTLLKPFVYPSAPPVGGVPNMGRLDYLGSSPSPSRGFADYLNSVGAGMPNPFAPSRGSVNKFTPYYRSYRQFDQGFQRQASSDANDEFYQDQAERHRRYVEALRERDPKKRQALMKQIEQDNRAAVRASSDPKRFRTYRESQRDAGGTEPGAARGATPTRNPNATPTTDEIDALPDPGPLPPDPNQPARRPGTSTTPLELRSLRRSGSSAMESDTNPVRVLERSRRSQRRAAQDLDTPPTLPGEAGEAANPSSDLPEMRDLPEPAPAEPSPIDIPGNLLDEPPTAP